MMRDQKNGYRTTGFISYCSHSELKIDEAVVKGLLNVRPVVDLFSSCSSEASDSQPRWACRMALIESRIDWFGRMAVPVKGRKGCSGTHVMGFYRSGMSRLVKNAVPQIPCNWIINDSWRFVHSCFRF
ncbi:hypothetical protein CEXT_181661 [Caerostris extrusa]|uniref:Uncharacterized protein n=1 Tax=Caerostris extrusa TaxID=172846 RepID=A0AAV4ML03_CAEEX|nr:hypothetical protein CEXT_181661 [Caerostris extrusa]